MSDKRKLILRHKDHVKHVEVWTWFKDGQAIHYTSNCPGNSPSKSEGDHTPLSAMRSFLLMTSPTEGWQVEKGHDDWHEYVEAFDSEFWEPKNCTSCEFVGQLAVTHGACGEDLCEDCELEHLSGSCKDCCMEAEYG